MKEDIDNYFVWDNKNLSDECMHAIGSALSISKLQELNLDSNTLLFFLLSELSLKISAWKYLPVVALLINQVKMVSKMHFQKMYCRPKFNGDFLYWVKDFEWVFLLYLFQVKKQCDLRRQLLFYQKKNKIHFWWGNLGPQNYKSFSFFFSH